jgi:hypothetical protein
MNIAALHDEVHLFEDLDVFQGIAVHGDEVGYLVFFEGAELLALGRREFGRGRNASFPAPPAQIPACGTITPLA